MDEYTEWKVRQARKWAEDVRDVRFHVIAAREHVGQLEAEMDMLKAVRYDQQGGGSGMEHGDDAMADYVAKLDNARERASGELDSWLEMVEEFTDSCSKLEGRFALLLRLRYAEGLDWETVASKMEGYDAAYVRGRLNCSALSALFGVMPHRLREPMHPAI